MVQKMFEKFREKMHREQIFFESFTRILATLSRIQECKSLSNCAFGKREHLRLEEHGKIWNVEIIENHDAIFTIQQQAQAKSCKNEAEFFDFIAPILNAELECCDMVFIDSHSHPWLSQYPNLSDDKKLRPDAIAYSPWPEEIQKVMWVSEASKSVFGNFLNDYKSSWVSLLIEACAMLGVELVDGNSFLGRGAHGMVFRVEKENQVFALKIVQEISTLHLQLEAFVLKLAHETGLTTCCVEEVIEMTKGAALLSSPVGRPIPYPKSKAGNRNLFKHLRKLHHEGSNSRRSSRA